MRLSKRTQSAYRERGFAVIGDAVDPATRRRLCAELDDWSRRRAAGGPFGILQNNIWRQVKSVADLVCAGELAAMARELLGSPEVVLFQDNLVWKPPGAARIEWHQDYSYWPLDAPTGVTFWLPLDDADAESGCLHYIPGTHRLGERQPADFIAGSGQPARTGLPPLGAAEREAEAVAVAVEAGALVAHHPLVWHMSPSNDSGRQRRALSFTWIGSDVHWDPNHAPHPFNHSLEPAAGEPVRGELFPRFEAASAGA